MEQRPLRLGDLVDDYCPRERRVTNHAIVAIVNDTIRQTRCTTCDAEHVFKDGKIPRRRPAKPVLAPSPAAADPGEVEVAAEREPAESETAPEPLALEAGATPDNAASEEPPPAHDQDDRERDAWPANRQLIRATLPRQEGDVPPPRPIPEFTIYQRHNGRNGGFRQSRWADNGMGSGRNGNHADRRGNGGPNGHHPGGQGHGRRRHKKRPR
jgi:hypothetical protein